MVVLDDTKRIQNKTSVEEQYNISFYILRRIHMFLLISFVIVIPLKRKQFWYQCKKKYRRVYTRLLFRVYRLPYKVYRLGIQKINKSLAPPLLTYHFQVSVFY